MKYFKIFENEILNERILNWFPQDAKSDDKFSYLWDDLDRLLNISYAAIGGFLKGNYTKESFMKGIALVKFIRKNGAIVAFVSYKSKHGRKVVAVGQDGTPAGKTALMALFQEDMTQKRAWVEVDAKMEHIYVDKYGAERIPNILVADILKKDIQSLDPDGFHYKREIKGHVYTKCMVAGDKKMLK